MSAKTNEDLTYQSQHIHRWSGAEAAFATMYNTVLSEGEGEGERRREGKGWEKVKQILLGVWKTLKSSVEMSTDYAVLN